MGKINKIEKCERKACLDALRSFKGFCVTVEGVTFVIVPTCRGMGEISWAICSPKEKFNRKRGQLVALRRWATGETLPLNVFGMTSKEEAERIAEDFLFPIMG